MDRTTHSANDICVCADCAADRRIERLEARVVELESRLKGVATRSDVLNLQSRCHGNKQRAQRNAKAIKEMGGATDVASAAIACGAGDER